MKYPRIEPGKLNGSEQITDENGNIVSDVSGFWSWAYSDVIDNTARGALAEYIVACALGVNGGIRKNWNKYDLVSPEGISVEVKSSGYIQGWDQEKLSKLEFGIQPTFGWDSDTNTFAQKKTRQADIYVFCVHKHKDQETINPLDISQWEFYLLPAYILNERAGSQKTAALSSLIRMGARKCEYRDIHSQIIKLTRGRRNGNV